MPVIGDPRTLLGPRTPTSPAAVAVPAAGIFVPFVLARFGIVVDLSLVAAICVGSLMTGSRALGLRATATLATAQIAAQTCATQAIGVPGAVAGGDCVVGSPAALEAGLVQACVVTAAGTATLRTCNVTAAPITPAGSQTVSVRVFSS